jgi:DNA-binding IclR family transcriptional regulator
VLVACADQELLERYDREIVARGKLKKATERSIVDRDKLIEHLQQVRVQGFATDLEECASGVVCAAAPIFDATSLLTGAIADVGAGDARRPGADRARARAACRRRGDPLVAAARRADLTRS